MTLDNTSSPFFFSSLIQQQKTKMCVSFFDIFSLAPFPSAHITHTQTHTQRNNFKSKFLLPFQFVVTNVQFQSLEIEFKTQKKWIIPNQNVVWQGSFQNANKNSRTTDWLRLWWSTEWNWDGEIAGCCWVVVGTEEEERNKQVSLFLFFYMNHSPGGW